MTHKESMLAKRTVLFLAAALLMAGCSSVERTWHGVVGGQNPLVGKIWNVREKRFISQTELVNDLSEVDFIILGEKHDNRDHHELQAELIRSIGKSNRKPKVAFEQLSIDQKPKLATYLELNPTSAAGIGDAVGWRQAGWPDWKIYEPVFQAALDSKMQIVAINFSAEEKKRVDSRGLDGLDDNLFRELDMHAKFPPSIEALLAEEIRSAHCYQLPDDLVPKFVEVQHARDAVMAKRAEENAKQDGAILIVGAGHARKEWGIPVFLRRINKLAKQASVAMLEVKPEYTRPEIYIEGDLPYDYVWFTPASSGEDACKKNAEQLQQISKTKNPKKASAPSEKQ